MKYPEKGFITLTDRQPPVTELNRKTFRCVLAYSSSVMSHGVWAPIVHDHVPSTIL